MSHCCKDPHRLGILGGMPVNWGLGISMDALRFRELFYSKADAKTKVMETIISNFRSTGKRNTNLWHYIATNGFKIADNLL